MSWGLRCTSPGCLHSVLEVHKGGIPVQWVNEWQWWWQNIHRWKQEKYLGQEISQVFLRLQYSFVYSVYWRTCICGGAKSLGSKLCQLNLYHHKVGWESWPQTCCYYRKPWHGFSTRRKTCLDIGGCDLAFLTRYWPGIILEPISAGLYGQALGKIDDLSIRGKETWKYLTEINTTSTFTKTVVAPKE